MEILELGTYFNMVVKRKIENTTSGVPQAMQASIEPN